MWRLWTGLILLNHFICHHSAQIINDYLHYRLATVGSRIKDLTEVQLFASMLWISILVCGCSAAHFSFWLTLLKEAAVGGRWRYILLPNAFWVVTVQSGRCSLHFAHFSKQSDEGKEDAATLQLYTVIPDGMMRTRGSTTEYIIVRVEITALTQSRENSSNLKCWLNRCLSYIHVPGSHPPTAAKFGML